MHSKQFIRIIDKAASNLGISTAHFSENWAIKLSYLNKTEYIIGYTFPLNNASTFKIVRNKNLCSEILSDNSIPNVPHKLLFHPLVLLKNLVSSGNQNTISNFINEYSFPLILKRNNTSGGDGVFIVNNESDLEEKILKIFANDHILCISPFRNIIHEYRNIILNGECLLSYEKCRPYVIGNGTKALINLLSEFISTNNYNQDGTDLFDDEFKNKLFYVPQKGEIIYLKWKHNASFGSSYILINNPVIKELAVNASKVVNSNFVTTDVIFSKEFGYEILEINASVVLDSFSAKSDENYQCCISIYKTAIENLFLES